MGMTPAEQARFETAMSQIAWLRSELGLPAQFDDSQDHESELVLRLEALEVHAYDANYHKNIREIANGLNAEIVPKT